jgi:hypothetical protein
MVDVEFFGHDAQGGVRGNEVGLLDPIVLFDGSQQVPQKD